MKKIILILLVIGLILISGCIPEVKVEDVNDCASDSDCIIVAQDYCRTVASINKNYLNIWERHLEKETEKYKGQRILCEPTLPLSFYEAKCVEGKCKAILIEEKLGISEEK